VNLLDLPILALASIVWSAAPPEPESVLEVPPALLEQVREAVTERAQSPERRLELLTDFVAKSDHFGFRYRADATYTVEQTFSTREGNCLAYTLLFLSVSRELGLDSHAREVSIPPSWQDEGRVVFDVGHVNVGVDTPSRHRTVDFEPDLLRSQLLAAPWRGREISDQRALAHFYNNRAAELLADGHVAVAGLWAKRALSLDATFFPAINTLGVIERRLGRLDTARDRFESALAVNPEAASVLFNLISLAEQSGNTADAARHRARLQSLHPDDPWFQWQLGRYYSRQGKVSDALTHYRRAFELDRRQARFAETLIDLLESMDRPGEADRIRGRSAQHHRLAEDRSSVPRIDKAAVGQARVKGAALKD